MSSRTGALVCALLLLVAGATATIGAVPARAVAAPLPAAAVTHSRAPSAQHARLPKLPQIDRDHVFVKFRSRPADLGTRLARAGARLGRSIGRTGWVSLATSGDAETVKNRLRHEPAVAKVELSYIRRADTVPNDPKYATVQSDYLAPLRMDRAWDITKGAGVTVAMIDTGVDLVHPDLAGRFVSNGIDEIHNDNNAQDDNGHGTMTAGIVAADINNARGIAGIAPAVKILPVKVLDSSGAGTDANIAAGIEDVAQMPEPGRPKVINMSLGGDGGGDVLCPAVQDAIDAGIVVVAATGNTFSDDVGFPASCAGVIAVSATDHTGSLATFSSYGWRTDIGAPGVDITSTALQTPPTSDAYETGSGTSFSAPIVSGVVALMRAHAPNADAATIRAGLLASARDVGPPGVDRDYGHGTVDPLAALEYPATTPYAPLAPAPILTIGIDEPNDTGSQATPLNIGNAGHAAQLSPENDEDWYAVTFNQADWYHVSVPERMDETHGILPVIELYDSSHHFLASQAATGGDLDFRITAPGAYFVRVSSLAGATADYKVTVTRGGAPDLFSPSVLELDTQATSVGIGDLNGDERADVAFLMDRFSTLPNTLVVVDQTPRGGYDVGDVLGVPFDVAGIPMGTPGGGLVVADATGDGKLDLLFPTTNGSSSTVNRVELIPQGVGGLDPGAEQSISAPGVKQIAVADLNGDTHPDLVIAGSNGVAVRWGPDFQSGAPTTVTTTSTSSLAVGEIANGGNPDIAAVVNGKATMFLNAGGDTFAPKVSAAQTGATDVAIDPAGAHHVIATYRTGGYLQELAGATGSLTKVSGNRSLLLPTPSAVVAAEIDGNGGGSDAIVLHDQFGLAGVLHSFTGTEELNFADISALDYDARALAVGDTDGNELNDLAVASSFGVTVLSHRRDSLPANYGKELLLSATPEPSATDVAIDVAPALHLTAAATNASDSTVKLYDAQGSEVGASVTGTTTVTLTPDAELAAGTYTLRVDGLKDAAGDQLDLARHFIVGPAPDEVAPTLSFIFPPSGFRTLNHETVTFTTNGTTLYCSLDNAVYSGSSCASPKALNNLAKGAHTFRVIAVDQAGNETAKSVSWTYRPPPVGYWMLGRGGTIYPFGTVPALGNGPTTNATDLAVTPSGYGYWIVDASGHVFAFGDANSYGNASGLVAGETVTSISRTLTGKGYWFFTSRGRVLNKGDAKFYGDMRNTRLAGPVLDSVSTPSGKGYYMVASDGGVFSFGDAHFWGSLGGKKLAAPVRTLTPDPDGKGYWLVGTNGAIYPFQAVSHGSMAGTRLSKPVVGMVAYGNAYLMVAADGGIFNFSTKPFRGSLGAHPPTIPIVSVAVYG